MAARDPFQPGDRVVRFRSAHVSSVLSAIGAFALWLTASVAVADDVVLIDVAVDVAVAAPAPAEKPAKEKPAGNQAKAAIGDGLIGIAQEMGWALGRIAPQKADLAPDEAQQAQLNAMMSEIRPTLITEVSFAKRVSEMNAEEEAAAIAAAKSAGRSFAEEYLQQNGQQQNGIMIFNGAPMRNQQGDPVAKLQSSVVEAIKKTLPPKKAAAYQEEVTLREEFRRSAVADNLTASIDDRLLLTEKQRAGIARSLRDEAKDNALPPLESLMHMGDYLPAMPEEPVVAHLDRDQLQLWKQIQKVHFGFSFHGNQQMVSGGNAIDDVDLGDE
jgi:hypothetical protein